MKGKRRKSREKIRVLIFEERERVDGCEIGGVGRGVNGERQGSWRPKSKRREGVRNLKRENVKRRERQ